MTISICVLHYHLLGFEKDVKIHIFKIKDEFQASTTFDYSYLLWLLIAHLS